jgi:hypothetical protein
LRLMPDKPDETAQEPKDCPRGHGPMRLRTRWAEPRARPGRRGSRAEPVTEWVCPRCGRTSPIN